MKKLLFLAALFAATTVQAQKVDSVQYAIQVKPIVVNALKKDTVFQVTWEAFGIKRSDSSTATLYYQFFDRKGRGFFSDNLVVPAPIVAIWLNNSVIDDYLLTFLGLQKR